MINLRAREQRGLSIYLDGGSNTGITWPLTPGFDGAAPDTLAYPFSIAIWVRPVNITTEKAAIYVGNSATSNDHFILGIDVSTAMIDAYAGSHDRTYASNTISAANTWTFLTARFISATDRQVYLNGDVGNKGTTALSRIVDRGAQGVIGLGRRFDSSPGDQFNGRFAHATIWRGVITETDIVNMARGLHPLRVQSAPLDFYFPCTDPSDAFRERAWGYMGTVNALGATPAFENLSPPIFSEPQPFVWWATASLQDIDITPSAAVAGSDSSIGEVGFGDININPLEVAAATASSIGGVDESDVDITPSPAEVVTSSSVSQVEQNSLAISPSAVAANTAKVDPIVELSDINIDPDDATAVAESTDPTVHYTGIDVTPAAAVAVCTGTDPNVDDAKNVFADPAVASATATEPTLGFSSVSVTPSVATAAVRSIYRIDLILYGVTAGTSASVGNVLAGIDIISLYPDAVSAAVSVTSPSLYFTSTSATPAPASSAVSTTDPTYIVYDNVSWPDPAVASADSVGPTVDFGSLVITPAAAETVAVSTAPTVFFSSTSSAPTPVVAATSVTQPIAGVFFMYFPEADSVLGDWRDENEGAVDIYQSIDEDPFDDADYVQSEWGPDQETYITKMERMSEPDDDTNHIIEYRYGKENDLTRMDLVVRLKQGATVIAGWSHDDISTTIVAARQILSEGEALQITDYKDLYLEFEAWER